MSHDMRRVHAFRGPACGNYVATAAYRRDMSWLSARNPTTGKGDSTQSLLLGAARGGHAWAASWRGGLGLIALCLCVLLPGLWQLPPIDRDESRFVQASRQMIESGDFVVPRVQDRPRLNKPPLIYWLQAGSTQVITGGDVSRDAVWMYRVPGVLCTILAVLATWKLGREMMDARAAWLAAALLAICPLVIFDAHQARSDQLLLLTVVLTQWALWRCLREPTMAKAAVVGLAMGVGILAKGPLTPMIAACTACVWLLGKRRIPDARDLLMTALAGVVALACVLPWVAMVAQQVGWSEYLEIIHRETLGRSVQPMERSYLPPGYHLVLLVALFFPGSLLTGAAVLHALRSKTDATGAGSPSRGFASRMFGRVPTSDRELFLLGWVVPSWIIFELVATKLPHYTMPLYPALALLTARLALRASEGRFAGMRERMPRIGFVIWGAVGTLALGGAPWGLLLAVRQAVPSIEVPTWVFVVAGATGAVAAALCIAGTLAALAERPLRTLLLSASATVLSLSCVLCAVLPNAEAVWVSKRVTQALNDSNTSGDMPMAAWEFHEDSMIFGTRGRVVRVDEDGEGKRGLRDFLSQHANSPVLVALIEERNGQPRERLAQLREFAGARTVTPLERVAGFNYSNGSRVVVVIARVEATP